MSRVSRRGFLTATAAVAAISPWSRVLGANSDIRVVVIGVNNMGRNHLNAFPKVPGARVVGMCDVDQRVLGTRAEEFEKQHGPVKKYDDLRRVFDDPEVDAVVLAVPNHWHALGTIWACQAGKDVYVEKPCSYNIWEANQMIQAAEKYQRIVQVGIQRRSMSRLQNWFKELQAGALGKIRSVHAVYYARRSGIGRPDGVLQPPAGVNHDLWSGPAALEIPRQAYHYNWHWFWETGNGELGNNGPHILDLARTAIGAKELPRKIWSLGGRYGWDDNGETPNSHIIYYGYEPAPIIMEIRNLPAKAKTTENNRYRGINMGIAVDCEEGSYVGFDSGVVYDRDGKEVRKIQGGGGPSHQENFIGAVRSRRAEDLNCDIPQGHLSSSLCHLGNISHRLGTSLTIDQAAERIKSSPVFGESGERLVEHLSANEIPTKTTEIWLGEELDFNPAAQSFPNAPAANALLKRSQQRAPFVIPDAV